MVIKLKRLTALCATVLCGASIALGQAPSDTDKHFVRDAIEDGNGEVQLGQLAQQKAGSADIKEFGQKMVTDHTKLGDQMKAVAEQIGVTVPSGTSVGGKATAAELKMLSGDSFDKAYIKAMVKNHRDDLQAFEKEATTGTSPAVRDAAKKGGMVVKHHLEMAEQIAKSHNVDVGK